MPDRLYGRAMNTNPTELLIRATLAADERTVRVAPGVELPTRAVDIATDIPRAPEGLPVCMVMFFETEVDRDEFAALFADDPAIHVRPL